MGSEMLIGDEVFGLLGPRYGPIDNLNEVLESICDDSKESDECGEEPSELLGFF